MALNICGICDSQDSHQGRANKGTLNTDSGISTAQILVSDFPLGEKQTAGLLKKSVFCIFCKVFQSDFFSPLLLLRKLNVLSLLALSCSSPCHGGEATCGPAAVRRSGTRTGGLQRADLSRQQSRQDSPADTCSSESLHGGPGWESRRRLHCRLVQRANGPAPVRGDGRCLASPAPACPTRLGFCGAAHGHHASLYWELGNAHMGQIFGF